MLSASSFFCLLIEGEGSGSLRPQNLRIPRIRNTSRGYLLLNLSISKLLHSQGYFVQPHHGRCSDQVPVWITRLRTGAARTRRELRVGRPVAGPPRNRRIRRGPADCPMEVGGGAGKFFSLFFLQFLSFVYNFFYFLLHTKSGRKFRGTVSR